MKNAFFIFISIFVVQYCFGQVIKPPELTPSRTNQEERAILDEGIALKDQGKDDEAIQKFKQILEKNPSNILAIHEMSRVYFSTKKYDEALNAASEGARYKSEYLPQFYKMIGNSLDELGRAAEAISAYQQAIKVLPNDALLHFNLGVTMVNSGNLNEAKPVLKTAIELDPKHPGSHYALAQIFFKQDYKIPSTLTLLRFLVLEPKTQRSKKALSMLNDNFAHQEESDDSQNKEQTDEGDFASLDRIISVKTESTGSIPQEIIVNALDRLFTMMGEMKITKGKFVTDYYFPYFIDLKKQNHLVPFCNYIFQSSDTQAQKWLNLHQEEADRFLKWSTSFNWPSPNSTK